MNKVADRKTILFVHHGVGIGGASINLRSVVKSFEGKGYDLIVLFLQDSDAKKLFLDIDCQIIISRFPIYYFYHMSKWVKYWQIHKLCIQGVSFLFHLLFVSRFYIKRLKPDIVYLNSSVLTDWCLSCYFLGVKNILNVQETISKGYFGLRKKLIKNIITKCSNRVLFISDFNRLCLVNSGFKNYDIIYNTLESSAGDIQKKPFTEKLYDFVYLGGDSYIKGWDYVNALLESNMTFTMCFAGSVSNEENIKLLVSDPRIIYMGVVDDATHLISNAKFLLSPFKEAHFSRPIMEAYYCDTVPIATDLPGVDEQLINDVTGALFLNDTESFLKMIRYATNINEAKYNDLINAAELFRLRFSIQSNQNAIIDSIQSVIKKR
ncbi:MAG: hypothetical protein CML20_11650 [Rheinheimera sp.]|nr:hypothetical protein [Rheinheimera sp.]